MPYFSVKKNQVSIHKVRVNADAKGEVYTKRRTWALDELKQVDGIDTSPVRKG